MNKVKLVPYSPSIGQSCRVWRENESRRGQVVLVIMWQSTPNWLVGKRTHCVACSY